MVIINDMKEHAAFVIGRQAGLHSDNDAVDRLTEQIIAARAELQEARVEYASKIATTKAHFDSEAAAMRRELSEALAQLDQLRLMLFQKWQRHKTDLLS
jgi:hypothetical protein